MNTDIKLVALDLDRTTLNSESHLSEVNRQALIDAISNGVHVCIASDVHLTHCLRISYQFLELNMQ